MPQPSSAGVRRVGLLLGALALLSSGCTADSADSTAASSPASTPSGEQSAAPADARSTGHASPKPAGKSQAHRQGQVLSVRVANGRVAERTGSSEVALGEKVRLHVECDTADEVHVHGYDASAPCAPGKAAAITFTADIPGVFEVELEESGLALLDLTVR